MALPTQGLAAVGTENRRRFVLLLGFRALIVTVLLSATLFFNLSRGFAGAALTYWLLYGLAGVVFLLTVVYLVWLRFGRLRLDRHLQAHIVFDVGVATLLVYVTGGVESPFTFFYALPIVHAAIFYPRRGAILTAGLSSLMLAALFVLENQGILPVDLEGRVGVAPETSRVAYLLATNFAVFFAIAWLAGYLGEQLRRAGRELRATEQDLEAMAALNRDIVLSLRSGLLALDDRGSLRLLNPVAEEILGLQANAVLGRSGVEVFPPLRQLLPSGERAGGSGGLRQEVEYVRPRDQRRLPIGLTLSPLRHPDGTSAGTLIHLQDLTELKALERSAKRSERMAALGAMAAAIAHEIRNPLASISGSAQMLSRASALGDTERRLMDIVTREAQRLDGLVGDFLAYARPREPQRVPTDLQALVREALDVFRQRASGQQWRVEDELDSLRAKVDPDQVRQILWNLLTNAAEAVVAGGRVRVGLRRVAAAAGSEAELTVADDGPGVPSELRERIFEPFFTTKDKGTGLGLATVSQLVAAHGGSLNLSCPPEGGSVLSVRLPGVLP